EIGDAAEDLEPEPFLAPQLLLALLRGPRLERMARDDDVRIAAGAARGAASLLAAAAAAAAPALAPFAARRLRLRVLAACRGKRDLARVGDLLSEAAESIGTAAASPAASLLPLLPLRVGDTRGDGDEHERDHERREERRHRARARAL